MNTAIGKRLEKDLLTIGAQLRRLLASDAATHERLVGRVKHLSDALHRLRAGTYGVCMECHEPTSVPSSSSTTARTCVLPAGSCSRLPVIDRKSVV